MCLENQQPCQTPASARLPLVQLIYLFIFINRNIRCLFVLDTANPLMNMPVKMKMKELVNYLLQHSARQINSNKKKEKSLPPTRLVNVLI